MLLWLLLFVPSPSSIIVATVAVAAATSAVEMVKLGFRSSPGDLVIGIEPILRTMVIFVSFVMLSGGLWVVVVASAVVAVAAAGCGFKKYFS